MISNEVSKEEKDSYSNKLYRDRESYTTNSVSFIIFDNQLIITTIQISLAVLAFSATVLGLNSFEQLSPSSFAISWLLLFGAIVIGILILKSNVNTNICFLNSRFETDQKEFLSKMNRNKVLANEVVAETAADKKIVTKYNKRECVYLFFFYLFFLFGFFFFLLTMAGFYYEDFFEKILS